MKRTVLLFAAMALVSILMLGCVSAPPERSVNTYTEELRATEAVLNDAKASGAAEECPARYMAAAAKRSEAVEVFWSCRTAEAIKIMRQARRQAEALCGEAEPLAEDAAGSAGAETKDEPVSSKEKSRKQKTAKPAPPKTKYAGEESAGTMKDEAAASGKKAPKQKIAKPAPAKIKPAPARDEAAKTAAATIKAVSSDEAPSDVIGIVRFDFDSTVIKPEFRQTLDGIADALRENPDVSVEIHGHADAEGPAAYNQGLSERRAAAVKRYLADGGVNGSRLKTFGHGEGDPVADNSTGEGRALNRRAELTPER